MQSCLKEFVQRLLAHKMQCGRMKELSRLDMSNRASVGTHWVYLNRQRKPLCLREWRAGKHRQFIDSRLVYDVR